MMRRDGRVIDFARFKAARERARLPLFDADSGRLVATLDELPGRRALSDRDVTHRKRMLAHLCGSQK